MPDFEVREWIAYGIIAVFAVAIVAGGIVHQRRARWRKLRLAGNGEAKRREMRRTR